jgi:hypothetical protein
MPVHVVQLQLRQPWMLFATLLQHELPLLQLE